MTYPKVGIIGGMSPIGTIAYYRCLTSRYDETEIYIGSLVDGYARELLSRSHDDFFKECSRVLNALEHCGVTTALIACNSAHVIHRRLQESTSISIPHVCDGVISALKQESISRVGLLATSHTTTNSTYLSLLELAGVTAILPNSREQKYIDHLIFEEACIGKISEASIEFLVSISESLLRHSAEAILLGCSDLSFFQDLFSANGIKIIDATEAHVFNSAS